MAQSSDPNLMLSIGRGAIWASVAVFGIVLSGVLLGVLIIPVVQGRSDGIDAYTAICRALGILPGSPARQQVADRTPPTPVSQVVWTPDVLQILADAKPERGRAKAQEVCVACHGEQGVSVAPEYPHLAGQSGAAIYKQLNDYRTGSRTHQLMTDIAKALDEPTLADVAAYYAAQPKRNPNPATLADSPPAIVRLVELGDPEPQHSALRGVPSARLGRSDRNTNSCRARGGIHCPAVEDVCLGRTAQRCLRTHAIDRREADAGRDRWTGGILSSRFQIVRQGHGCGWRQTDSDVSILRNCPFMALNRRANRTYNCRVAGVERKRLE